MEILNPIALNLMFAPLFLILFYFLKGGKDNIKINSLLFWDNLEDNSSSFSIKFRFEKDLLFYLQLFIILLLIFALLQPVLNQKVQESNKLIFIIDRSASLNANDVKGSRFSNLKKTLLEDLEKISPNTQIALIEADSNPEIVFNFIEDKDKIIEYIEDSNLSEESLDVAETFALIKLLKNNSDHVYFYSDGAFDLEKREYKEIFNDDNFKLVKIGNSINNIGITNFSIQEKQGMPGQYKCFLEISNFSTNDEEVKIELKKERMIILRDLLMVNSGSKIIKEYDFKSDKSNLFQIALDHQDDFSLDNTVKFKLGEEIAEKFSVAFIGKDNYFLERAFLVIPGVSFVKRNTLPDSYYNLYVFNEINPPPNFKKNSIVINSNKKTKNINVVDVMSWEQSHPLFRFVNFSEVKVKQPNHEFISPTANNILHSTSGPLMALLDEKNYKKLEIAFSLNNSNLLLQSSFPVFIVNYIKLLNPGFMNANYSNIKTGEVYKYIPYKNNEIDSVINPKGKNIEYVQNGNFYYIENTELKGVYEIQFNNGEKDYFSANLLSKKESRLNNSLESTKQKNNVIEKSDFKSEKKDNITVIYKDLWPYLLWIILILLFLEGILAIKRGNKSIIIISLHIFVVLFLILALFQPVINTYTRKQNIIFLADRSTSMRKYNLDKLKFIKDSLEKINDEDKYGIISFAEDQFIEKRFDENSEFNSFQSNLNNNFTDIENALKKASHLLPSDSKAKVILLSDGEENIGNLESVIDNYKKRNIEIDSYNLNHKEISEVFLQNLILPKRVDPGVDFNLRVYLRSNTKQSTILRIYQDDVLILEKNIEIKPENNNFKFSTNISEAGFHNYRVEIEAEDDFYKMNNILEDYIFVRGKSSILILNNQSETHAKFINLLIQNNFYVNEVSSRFFSYNLNELEKYDLVIMENVSADSLNLRQMQNIVTYTDDSGGGILFIGGKNSFGAGNYGDSPLDSLSPLSSKVKSEVFFPSISIVIAIDKSDSMKEIQNAAGNLTKLDLAKEATIGIIDFLIKDEKLGVVGFDSNSLVLSPLEEIKDKYRLFERFAQIKASGGTNIYDGLEEAFNLLLEDDSSVKHIILISDGKTTSADFELILKKINNNKITLTTVAVGSKADELLMKKLAKEGKGKYYYANTVDTLPGIFAVEAKRITNPAVIKKESRIKVSSNLKEITKINPANIPLINKYNATSQQKTADVLMASEDDFPLLATWRFGLGRVAAFSGDTGTDFNKNWLGWSEYDKFWLDMIRWVKRPNESSFLIPEIIKKDDQLLLTVSVINDKGEYINHLDLNGIVYGPGNYQKKLKLKQTGSGFYENAIKITEPGSYLFNFNFKDSKGKIHSKRTAYVLSYSPEYFPMNGEKNIKKLVAETGGKFLKGPEEVLADRPLLISGQKNLWPYLVFASLILFLLEIALRIISFDLLKRLILSFTNRITAFIEKIKRESQNL